MLSPKVTGACVLVTSLLGSSLVQAGTPVGTITTGNAPISFKLPTKPFIIEVVHVTGDPIVGYLDTTGQTHNLCRLASQWQILDGHLLQKAGLQPVSVSKNVPVSKFSATGTHGMSVDTNFTVGPDGNLSWQNAAFADGSAAFGTDADDVVYAVFEGALPANLSAASLKALKVTDCQDLPGSSSAGSPSTLVKKATPTIGPVPISSTNPKCDNAFSSYNGEAVNNVAYNFAEGFISTDATSPYACCLSCQNTPGCVYSQYADNTGCNQALAGGQGCSPVGYFYTTPHVSPSITIANGTCGEILYGGTTGMEKPATSIVASSSSNVPKATASANANCENGISSVNGQAVTIVKADVEGTFPNNAATPLDCCVSCQNEPGCQYAQFTTGSGCTLALASGQCSAGSFFVSPKAEVSTTVYNGTCGGVVFGGEAA